MMRNRLSFQVYLIGTIVVVAACWLGALLVYNLPPVHERLSPRIDTWRAQVKYFFNPPEEAVFVPQEQSQLTPTLDIDILVQVALTAAAPSVTASPTASATATQPGPTQTPAPTATGTTTPTPLPQSVVLQGVKYEDQHGRWNYCGPANLSMALTFWGWNGNRDVVGKAIKPSDKDKNVMPYEMESFVDDQADGLNALVRNGGDLDLVRRMLAAGFPVLAEKGYYEYDYNGKLGWMGHYQFITGYDDASGMFLVQDTYNDGPNHQVLYADFITGWRDFNYIFMIVYPLARQEEVLALLGPWADPAWANQHALETARDETEMLAGVDLFFAWFNVGSNHVNLQQYVDAASAYDYAFQLYAGLAKNDEVRPYRMLWYQTGPYWAYYYSGRYQDLISLADTTLNDTISEPVLEESLYWRGLGRLAIGDRQGAIQDFRDSLQWHPGFEPSLAQLEQLGVAP